MSYNLNENLSESFTFSVNYQDRDINYVFRYPTTEEVQKFLDAKEDDQQKELFKFIGPESKSDPEFDKVYPKLSIKQAVNFNKMVSEEFNTEI